MEENTELLTPEENLSEMSDKLLATIIPTTDESKEQRRYMFGQIPTRALRGENFIIYHTFA